MRTGRDVKTIIRYEPFHWFELMEMVKELSAKIEILEETVNRMR